MASPILSSLIISIRGVEFQFDKRNRGEAAFDYRKKKGGLLQQTLRHAASAGVERRGRLCVASLLKPAQDTKGPHGNILRRFVGQEGAM